MGLTQVEIGKSSMAKLYFTQLKQTEKITKNGCPMILNLRNHCVTVNLLIKDL